MKQLTNEEVSNTFESEKAHLEHTYNIIECVKNGCSWKEVAPLKADEIYYPRTKAFFYILSNTSIDKPLDSLKYLSVSDYSLLYKISRLGVNRFNVNKSMENAIDQLKERYYG